MSNPWKALSLSELSFTYIKILITTENILKWIPIIAVDTLKTASVDKALKTSINCCANKELKFKLPFIKSTNIYVYGLSFESSGTNHSDDYIIVNTSKIDLSSAIYFKNVINLTVNNSGFTRSRGYGFVMVDVMNALFYKGKVEDNTLMQLLKLLYGGGIILMSSSIGVSNNNNVTFANCIFQKIVRLGMLEVFPVSNQTMTQKVIFLKKGYMSIVGPYHSTCGAKRCLLI